MAGGATNSLVAKNKPPAAGRGRPKGSPNKVQAAVKDMVLQALNEAHEDGGAAYLKEQATKNPTAFLTLVGKVLPLQLTGKDGGPIETADVTEDVERVDRLIGSLAERIIGGATMQ